MIIFPLAFIFSTRLLGLFMVLPVIMLYENKLDGATPLLLGLVLGSYGLTQALMQIPFGMLSDRYGRKPILLLGLSLFIIGSVVAGMTDNVYVMIIGRILQGLGAIGSTILAWVADVTEERQRAIAMAVIGGSIALAFFLAMLLGPVVNELFSLRGIFWLTALLGLAGLLWILAIPDQYQQQSYHAKFQQTIVKVLSDSNLIRMNLGVFLLHAILAAMFIYIPSQAVSTLAIASHDLWLFYAVVLLLALVIMLPMLLIVRRWGQEKQMLLFNVALLCVSQILLLTLAQDPVFFILAMILFFAAFTYLEAAIPAVLTKLVTKKSKGLAMGIYSSLQFLGVFGGGSFGGILYNSAKITLFCLALALLFLWLVFELRLSVKVK